MKVQSEKAKVKTAPVSERSKRILSEATTPYLVDEKRAALAEFLARLETEHAKDIARVILFGSHARGDADEESDVDLLVVAQGDIENARRVYHWCAENDTPWVSPLVISESDYQEDQRFKPPFYVNLRRDGVELWDPIAWDTETREIQLDFIEGESRMLDYETIMTIRVYLHNMKENLDVARDMEQNHIGRAVSELYYAAFYITTAALYTVNVVRGKHKGVRDAVNEFLVKPGLLEKEYGEIYGDFLEGRLNVDYRPSKKIKGEKILTDDELHQLFRDGERYMERIKRFLIERGLDASDFKS
jgi:uncharacterized protein (UPF0332 family)/predicted nucleotidyltransferase